VALKRVCDITGTDRDVEICDVTIAGQAIKLDLAPAGAAKLREFFGSVVTVEHPLDTVVLEAEVSQDVGGEVPPVAHYTAPAPQQAAAAEPVVHRSARGGRKPAAVKARRTKTAPRAAVSAAQETSDIRAWARTNGFEIRDRGAIPGRIRSAYALAQE
jgi:hypothetical protein